MIRSSVTTASGAREAKHNDGSAPFRSEEHTSELQSRLHLACRLLLENRRPSPRVTPALDTAPCWSGVAHPAARPRVFPAPRVSALTGCPVAPASFLFFSRPGRPHLPPPSPTPRRSA